jgi:hypothetical protein
MVVTMAGKAIGAAKTVPPTAANANPTVRSTLKNFGVGAFALLMIFFIINFYCHFRIGGNQDWISISTLSLLSKAL